MGVSRADNSVIFNEICPLAIPNQISTISMHIPSLDKIHWCLLKLSSGNEMDGWTDGRTTDGRTDGRTTDVQRETIIPRHYYVVWYNYIKQLVINKQFQRRSTHLQKNYCSKSHRLPRCHYHNSKLNTTAFARSTHNSVGHMTFIRHCIDVEVTLCKSMR